MELFDALSGRAGPDGIRWLLLGHGPRCALERALSGMLSAPATLGACHLRAARFRVRPDLKLSAVYDVEVLSNGRSEKKTRAVAVTWKPKWVGKECAGQASADVTEMEAEALSRGLAAPFRRLTTRALAWGMRIQVSPLDASFPQLGRASDPECVGPLLASVTASTSCVKGQEPVGRYGVTSIRYQPGQRHVLRYDSLGAPTQQTIFAKLYNNVEGSRIQNVVTQAADWLSARLEGVTCLQPLAYLAQDNVLLYPGVSGTPLNKHLTRSRGNGGRHLEAAGAASSTLHRTPPSLFGLLGSHSFDAEIGEILRASDYIPVLLPSVGAVIEALLDRAREVYEGLPQEPPTFTQGDLKTEHFWIVPRGLTLIDFDTAHLADPALDIGKFLADLQFWFDTYGLSGIEQAEERFLAGYAQGVPSDRLVRARLFEALELVKISVRRVYLFECDWAARIERLVSRAKTLLNELDEVRDKAGKHILLHQGTSRREVQYACSNDCSGGALARLPLPAARH